MNVLIIAHTYIPLESGDVQRGGTKKSVTFTYAMLTQCEGDNENNEFFDPFSLNTSAGRGAKYMSIYPSQ